MSRKTLKERIATRITRSKREVFLRKDFEDLGGYDQVGRVLKQLTDEAMIVKIGYGIYAKAKLGILSGRPVPRIGIQAVMEALVRLGVEIVPSKADQDYNSGKSTQVPTGRCIGIKGKRIQRNFEYNGYSFVLERVTES